MAATRANEKMFMEKLARLRAFKKETTRFEDSLSTAGGMIIGDINWETPAYNINLDIFGYDLDSYKLDMFTPDVETLLEEAIKENKRRYVFMDTTIRSPTDLIEDWSLEWTKIFYEKAVRYWEELEHAVRPRRPFRKMFTRAASTPVTFAETFPLVNAYRLSNQTINLPAPTVEPLTLEPDTIPWDKHLWGGYTPTYMFDTNEVAVLVERLDAKKRGLWDATEKVRTKKMRMLVDDLDGDAVDIKYLQRTNGDDRSFEMQKILGSA
ncbi:hypothetical protein T484DRAFT_1863207 [Baffinella frigidus]|nr:hypothetical protein T484DRAFT_1863207 [Cryptophyta sp. CCMP2293]